MDNNSNTNGPAENQQAIPPLIDPGSTQSPPKNPPQENLFERIRSAFEQGAADAKTAADKAMPKVKVAAADALYSTAYGVAFAAIFQWTAAKHLAPECLKSGLRAGTDAGREAAKSWTSKMSQHPASPPPTPATSADSAPPPIITENPQNAF